MLNIMVNRVRVARVLMDMLGLNFRAPLGHCVQVSSDSSLRGSSPPQTAVQIGSLGRNADALFFFF